MRRLRDRGAAFFVLRSRAAVSARRVCRIAMHARGNRPKAGKTAYIDH